MKKLQLKKLIKEEVSNLVGHARNELEIAGYEISEAAPTIESDNDYANMCAIGALELIEKFAGQGHSGLSAGITLSLFDTLSKWGNLSPITSNPKEWMDVSEHGGEKGKMWQSRRNPAVFSEDGGQTWYNIDEKTIQEAREIVVVRSLICEIINDKQRKISMKKSELRQFIKEEIKVFVLESKKDIPKELKDEFKRKPYDIQSITKCMRNKVKNYSSVGNNGYDIYTLNFT